MGIFYDVVYIIELKFGTEIRYIVGMDSVLCDAVFCIDKITKPSFIKSNFNSLFLLNILV